jgi:hypothetical protein
MPYIRGAVAEVSGACVTAAAFPRPLLRGAAETPQRKETPMQTLEEMKAESYAQIVATVLGNEVSRGELAAAFNKVCNAENWKLPVKASVFANEQERAMIAAAVGFFTGSVATFKALKGGNYRVSAPGYYATIGS